MPEISPELFTRSATHKYRAEGRIVLLGGETGGSVLHHRYRRCARRALRIGVLAGAESHDVSTVPSAPIRRRISKPSASIRSTLFAGDRGWLQGVMDSTAQALAPRDAAAYHRVPRSRSPGAPIGVISAMIRTRHGSPRWLIAAPPCPDLDPRGVGNWFLPEVRGERHGRTWF